MAGPHTHRIVIVSPRGDVRRINYDDANRAGWGWTDLLLTATKRRGIQWAGFFEADPSAPHGFACIAQHVRSTA